MRSPVGDGIGDALGYSLVLDVTRAVGATPREAFVLAQDEARWELGHGGYTGSIAEKDSFRIFRHEKLFAADVDLLELAHNVLGEGCSIVQTERQRAWIAQVREKVDDKWGDAGCFLVQPGLYVFFGWAST